MATDFHSRALFDWTLTLSTETIECPIRVTDRDDLEKLHQFCLGEMERCSLTPADGNIETILERKEETVAIKFVNDDEYHPIKLSLPFSLFGDKSKEVEEQLTWLKERIADENRFETAFRKFDNIRWTELSAKEVSKKWETVFPGSPKVKKSQMIDMLWEWKRTNWHSWWRHENRFDFVEIVEKW